MIALASKWKDNDVSRLAGGSLEAALARITAKLFVIAIEEDGFFPLKDIAAEQRLIRGSELKRVSSSWGHLALLGVDPGYNARIDAYLKELLETP